MKWLDRLRLPPTRPLDDELSDHVDRINRMARTFDEGEPLSRELRAALAPPSRAFAEGPETIPFKSPPPVGDAELLRNMEAALKEPQSMNSPSVTAASPSDAHRIMARAMLDELDKMEREALDAIKAEENRHRDAVAAEDERHAKAIDNIEQSLKDTRRKASGYNALFGSLEPVASIDAGQGMLAFDPATVDHEPETIP